MSDTPGLARAEWARRGLLASLPIGAAVAAWALLRPAPRGPGYREVARWRVPGGQGRFIAIGPEPTLDDLQALGQRLREELRRLDNAVVMVFDDLEAAWQVRQGSRVIGEERFQAALSHQRAMYVKQAARGEHRFVIYERYPKSLEEIRY